jgi:HEAT repeat protein
MRRASFKAGVWLTLLLLLLIAAWLIFNGNGRNTQAKLDRLVRELRSEEPWYYRLAVQTRTLRLLPKRAAQNSLARELRRDKAVRDLIQLGTNAWPSVPSLLRMVTNNNRSIAYSAAGALAGIKAEQHPDWSGLQKLLAGQQAAAEVFRDLVAMNSGQSSDIAFPRFGLIGLAATGPAAVTAYTNLIELLKFNNEPGLRGPAVTALVGIESERQNVIPLLRTIAQNKDEWPQVSAAAVEGLARVVPAAPETHSLLHDALEDRRSLVRLVCSLKAPASDVLPVLTALLDHKLTNVRLGALSAISDMGSAARESRSAVQRLTSDQNETVRHAARAALKSISDGEALDRPSQDIQRQR